MSDFMLQNTPHTLGRGQQRLVGLLIDKDDWINQVAHTQADTTFEAGRIEIRNVEDVQAAEIGPVLYRGPDLEVKRPLSSFMVIGRGVLLPAPAGIS